jgi:hypothetical protein
VQIVYGMQQRCHWHVLVGAAHHDDWERYFSSLCAMVAHLELGDLLLDIWHDTGRPSPPQRQQFTTWFGQTKEVERVRGHAFVTNSAVSRGLLTAVNWVVKPPFNERACSSPTEGLSWLRQLRTDLDPEALSASMSSSAPLLTTLRW